MTESDPARLAMLESILKQSHRAILSRESEVLPIVFHIVYKTPQQNISDLQIRSQIDILNRDFAFMSENVSKVPEEFKSLGGDSGIRFCLASIDPDGNSTNGITRSQTTVDFIGRHQQSNGRHSVHYDIYDGKDAWDPERYINVWVADLDGILGSASFPGIAPFPEEDGVIIDAKYVGATGSATQSAPFDRGHTLTHELGHYFGLFHIWGLGTGGCNSDDMIEDTPEQDSPYIDCPEHPQVSCGSSDMFMNFMDFTDDRCLALFTQGQNQRMLSTLMTIRAALLGNANACAPPDNDVIDLDAVNVFYAPESKQIIIALDNVSIVPRIVTVYTIDGRMVYHNDWMIGSVFSLDADGFPSGVYVVQLESQGERAATKVVVY